MQIKEYVPLSDYSTFGIGGPARWFITVKTAEMMQEAIQFAAKMGIPFHILGKGSNTLFDDRGFAGLVIQNKIGSYSHENEQFHVGAGFSFALLGVRSAKMGYRGLEFASGIPATVGGAIFMNAGANGQETKDCLAEVDYVDENGTLHKYPKNELTFSYRHSSFQNLRGAVVSATFILHQDDKAKERQQQILSHRQSTQPLQEPSCGCIFRNPEGGFAGKLIEEAGLKGVSLGGAAISSLHANFIVNKGGAKASDVEGLIAKIQEEVQKKSNIALESEIWRLPYE